MLIIPFTRGLSYRYLIGILRLADGKPSTQSLHSVNLHFPNDVQRYKKKLTFANFYAEKVRNICIYAKFFVTLHRVRSVSRQTLHRVRSVSRHRDSESCRDSES